METNADKLAVARECLNYLGAFPDKLKQAPPGARRHSAEVAITLGNWLLWISPKLEPTAPPCYRQSGGEPDSVAALGRKFREVGLDLWNAPDGLDDTPKVLAKLLGEAIDKVTALHREMKGGTR